MFLLLSMSDDLGQGLYFLGVYHSKEAAEASMMPGCGSFTEGDAQIKALLDTRDGVPLKEAWRTVCRHGASYLLAEY